MGWVTDSQTGEVIAGVARDSETVKRQLVELAREFGASSVQLASGEVVPVLPIEEVQQVREEGEI